MKPSVKRTLVYLWASPTTAAGLLAASLTCLTGGKWQVRQGAIECHGGFARWFLSRRAVSASAMTLGHVILGRSLEDLDRCREHEQVHVRQVERWGGLFLPAYLIASGLAWRAGRHYYLDNRFELDARRKCFEGEFEPRPTGIDPELEETPCQRSSNDDSSPEGLAAEQGAE